MLERERGSASSRPRFGCRKETKVGGYAEDVCDARRRGEEGTDGLILVAMHYGQHKVGVVVEEDHALDVAHRNTEVSSDLPVL